MAKTAAEIKTEAFAILTGMDPTATPSAEELAIFNVYYGPLLAELSADDVVDIDDENAVDDEYFLSIARLLANVAGPRFGSPMNEDAKLTDYATLRRLGRVRSTYLPVRVDYF